MKLKLLSVASIIVGCGLASSAFAQSLFEGATAPTGGVILEQLVGGSTSGSPGAGSHDYLNNPPPGEMFTLGSAASLAAVTVQGNGDAGYWSGSAGYQPMSTMPDTTGLQWNIQIGTVSGTTITPISTQSVLGFAPTGASDFLSFNLASPIALAAGTTYEFSLNLVNTHSVAGDSTWYGLSESLTPVIGGNAIDSGTVGAFGTTATSLPYDFVFVLSSQAVPEPGTIALLSLGGLALIAFRRRA
jgi:hypothetical protein